MAVLLLVSGPAAAQDPNAPEPTGHCTELYWLSPHQLYALLNSDMLEDLAKSEIEAADGGRRNAFSWCLAGELLAQLKVAQLGDAERASLPRYRKRVWDALASLDFNVLEQDVFKAEFILRVLSTKYGDAFSSLAAVTGRGGLGCTDGDCTTELERQGGTTGTPAAPGEVEAAEPERPKKPLFPGLNVATLPQTPQQPGSDCRSASSFRTSTDPDVRRFAKQLTDQRICYKVNNVVENGVRWVMQQFESTAKPSGPTLFVPHDNADTAFETAVYALERYGGRVVTIHTGETRSNGRTDGLRNFGASAEQISGCSQMKGSPAPAYTDYVLNTMPAGQPVLVLLNIQDGNSATPDLPGAVTRQTAEGSAVSADADDFAAVAGTIGLQDDPRAQSLMKALTQAGLNARHRTLPGGVSDCSLAGHAAVRGRPYLGLYAQAGHGTEQKAMLDAVLNLQVPDE
ncbi:MAG: hypothetical protein AAF441_22605 [Pseudomonadota bacterium]